MCTSDFSLKLIAAACLLIIATDSFVLQQILDKQDLIHMTSDPEVYQECYKPQIRMRIIFTAYAINSAGVCFVLTMALMWCDEFSEWFDKIVNWVAEYMYLAFGPVLFCFCLFGLTSIPELAHECTPTRITERLNLMDITILLICTALSFCIVFLYGLQHTNRLAEKELGDEHSVFYQMFSTYLNRQRSKYHLERKRRGQRRLQSSSGFSNSHEETAVSAAAAAHMNNGQHRMALHYDHSHTDLEGEPAEPQAADSFDSTPLKFGHEISSDSVSKASAGAATHRSYNGDMTMPLPDLNQIRTESGAAQ